MPCDAKLVPYWKETGGIDKIITPNGEAVSCMLDQLTLTEPTGTGYIPHWATCPSADEHRVESRTSYALNANSKDQRIP